MILLAILLAAEPIGRTRICDKADATKCASVDATGKVSIGGTISASSSTHSTAAAPTYVEGTDNPFSSDLTGSLRIICMGGTCGGASPFGDNTAFTAGTTSVNVVAGVFNDSITALTSGRAGAPRLTSFRAMHFNLRDASGAEIPFPAALAASGGLKVDVQNSVTVTGPLTDTQLRASAVPTTDAHTTAAVPLSLRLSDGAAFYDATKTGQLPAALDGSGFLKVHEQGNASVVGAAASGAAKSGNPVQVGGVFNTTQPTVTTGQAVEAQATARGGLIVATGADTFNATVSGAVTTTPPSNASTNVTQFGSTNVATGTGAGGVGIPRVTVSNDSTVGLVAGSAIIGKVGIDQTTPGTTNGVQVNAALPAGTNVIGKVSIDQTTPGTTNAVQVTGSLPTGSNTIGALTGNQSVNLNQVGGGTVQTGAGSATGTQRVTLATSDGVVLATANGGRPQVDVVSGGGSNASVGTNYSTAPASSTVVGGTAPNGTTVPIRVAPDGSLYVAMPPPLKTSLLAATASKAMIVGPSGTPVSVLGARQAPTGNEPAQVVAIAPIPAPLCPNVVALSQTASTTVITGMAGKLTYICKVFVVSSTAQSVSITEGTGSTCGTGSAALAGSATVANGMGLAANGGWVEGDGSAAAYTAKKVGDDICVLQSGAGNVAGSISYVQF